jgi:hypothetical protein
MMWWYCCCCVCYCAIVRVCASCVCVFFFKTEVFSPQFACRKEVRTCLCQVLTVLHFLILERLLHHILSVCKFTQFLSIIFTISLSFVFDFHTDCKYSVVESLLQVPIQVDPITLFRLLFEDFFCFRLCCLVLTLCIITYIRLNKMSSISCGRGHHVDRYITTALLNSISLHPILYSFTSSVFKQCYLVQVVIMWNLSQSLNEKFRCPIFSKLVACDIC